MTQTEDNVDCFGDHHLHSTSVHSVSPGVRLALWFSPQSRDNFPPYLVINNLEWTHVSYKQVETEEEEEEKIFPMSLLHYRLLLLKMVKSEAHGWTETFPPENVFFTFGSVTLATQPSDLLMMIMIR